MKRFIIKSLLRLKSKMGFSPKKVDVDSVIQENLELIKQIRLNRMRFYKHYKKSQTGY